MKESMKYMTVAEQELYEKLVEKYQIKGYTTPNSLTCHKAFLKEKDFLKRNKDKK
jgi:hypothetical protein